MGEEKVRDFDFNISPDVWIDEESMSERELDLIEAVLPDLIKLVLSEQVTEEG